MIKTLLFSENDDPLDMTPPLLLDTEQGAAECGEKPGTLNVLTQTDQVSVAMVTTTPLQCLGKSGSLYLIWNNIFSKMSRNNM